MANYNSFVFDGHGLSEFDGSFDPGATSRGVTEHDLVTTINSYTREFLNKTNLSIHYDEQNYIDKDFVGNTYSANAGVSVHINAGGGTGTEMYVPINEKNLTFEFELLLGLSSCMGVNNRGVKSRDYNTGNTVIRTDGVAYGGTDYYKEIRDAWKQGISLAILEVGFIDTDDLAKMLAKSKEIGYLIATYICRLCDVNPPSFETSATPTKTAVTSSAVSTSSNTTSQLVKIVNDAIYVIDGPSPENNIVQTIYKGEVYTIVEVKNGYGKLKSGAGWINLKYTTAVDQNQNDSSFRVEIVNNAIYVIDGPSPENNIVQTIYKGGVYTIVEVKNGYGRLKSGAGWINLSYTRRL